MCDGIVCRGRRKPVRVTESAWLRLFPIGNKVGLETTEKRRLGAQHRVQLVPLVLATRVRLIVAAVMIGIHTAAALRLIIRGGTIVSVVNAQIRVYTGMILICVWSGVVVGGGSGRIVVSVRIVVVEVFGQQ